MANVIRLRRSAVQGNVPTTAQLALGEVAINTHDGKIFIKKDDGTETVLDPGYNGAIISDTTPSARPDGSPVQDGDQWWESDTGYLHVRYTGAWVQVSGSGGGGGIPEAPQDGNYYVRQNGAWVDLKLALSALGVPVEEPIDAGNFNTGFTAATTNTTYDAGDFTANTSAATTSDTVDGGAFT